MQMQVFMGNADDGKTSKLQKIQNRLECLIAFARKLSEFEAAELLDGDPLLAGNLAARRNPLERPQSLEGIAF